MRGSRAGRPGLLRASPARPQRSTGDWAAGDDIAAGRERMFRRGGSDGSIVGITIVNARVLLDRDDLAITLPYVVDVQRDELEFALH